MKLAILYEDNDIMVQFTPEEFKEELKKYLKGDVDEAMRKIIVELKKKTLVV